MPIWGVDMSMNKTTYGLYSFKSIIKIHANGEYDDVSAAHMAHKAADDRAARMTGRLYSIPSLDEFLEAIRAIRSGGEG